MSIASPARSVTPFPSGWKRPLAFMAAAQALSQSASVFIMTLSSLASGLLSSDPSLSSLPIAAAIFGTLVGLFPMAAFMKRSGRRVGFIVSAFIGLAGAAFAVLGLAVRNFPLFVLAHLLVGVQQAGFQYLRFAASEVVPSAQRSVAVSLVLSGGVIAAFAGPWLAHLSRSLGLDLAFGLAYAPLAVLFALLVLCIVFAGRLDAVPHEPPAGSAPSTGPAQSSDHVGPRSFGVIFSQTNYLQALVGSVVGYALMILLMTATPISMDHHGFVSHEVSWVIQWHVLGMFVPSFFTGFLIKRFGTNVILTAGVIALVLDVLGALILPGLWSYWISLIFLGIGWNFLYIASTTRLTQTYQPSEKDKAQAGHDIIVFVFNTGATYAAAPLLAALGWVPLNLVALPVLALCAFWILPAWGRARKASPKGIHSGA